MSPKWDARLIWVKQFEHSNHLCWRSASWSKCSLCICLYIFVCRFLFLVVRLVILDVSFSFCSCRHLFLILSSLNSTLNILIYIVNLIWALIKHRSVRVAERLALPTSVHGVAGSNPAGGEILLEPKRRFSAQSLSCSPFHRLEMTEILLKGRKTLTHPSIHLIIHGIENCCFL